MRIAAEKFNLESKEKWKSDGNLANGSLMRCSPLIIYGHQLSEDDLYRMVRADASLSYANTYVRY